MSRLSLNVLRLYIHRLVDSLQPATSNTRTPRDGVQKHVAENEGAADTKRIKAKTDNIACQVNKISPNIPSFPLRA